MITSSSNHSVTSPRRTSDSLYCFQFLILYCLSVVSCFALLARGRSVERIESPFRRFYAARTRIVRQGRLSLESWYNVLDRLDKYVSAEQLNRYYEAAFSDLVAEGKLSFDAVFFDEKRWYEIDSLEDLDAAEEHFMRTDEPFFVNNLVKRLVEKLVEKLRVQEPAKHHFRTGCASSGVALFGKWI